MRTRDSILVTADSRLSFPTLSIAFLGAMLFFLASPIVGAAALIPLPIACLVWLACKKNITHTGLLFILGWIVGLGWSTPLFYWLGALHWGAALLTIAAYAVLPGFFVLSVSFAVKRRLADHYLALWCACTWTSLVEFLSSDTFFTLPPYGLSYYLWEWPVFIQSAEYSGSFAASFWLALVGACIALIFRSNSRKQLLAIAGIATAINLLPALKENGTSVIEQDHPSATVSVAAIRTLHDRQIKQEPGTADAMIDLTRDLAESKDEVAPPDLIVWPETAVPVWLRSSEQRDLVRELGTLAKELNASLLIGAHALEHGKGGAAKRYNASFLVPPTGFVAQEYHKVMLAPGTEKSPIPKAFPAALKGRYPSRLAAGDKPGLFVMPDGQKIGVFICWELFFPNFVRKLTIGGSELLINMSNDDAAFGKLTRAYQIPLPHLVMRAIENRRSIVRSANVGASLAIDPSGRITAFENGLAESGIRIEANLNSDLTTYTKFGNAGVGLLAIVTMIWGIVLFGQSRRLRGEAATGTQSVK